MRIKHFGLVALVAAMTVLPTVSITPAEAQNWFQRTFNRVYAPQPYVNYTDPYAYQNPYNNYGYNNNFGYNNGFNTGFNTGTSGTGVNWNQLVSSGQIPKAQHDAWVASINARVARGELTLSQGNMILTRGFE